MATEFHLVCALPAARAHLCARVLSSGGIPLVDLTCAPDAVELPDGAWVRVRSMESVPGTGPVVLAVGTPDAAPISGRPTWLEVTDESSVATGFAGIILRGQEAGGPCGERPGLELLRSSQSELPIILDAGIGPGEVSSAIRSGAVGIVLSDLLLGLPALELPTRLRARLDRADDSTSHLVNGFRIQAAPLAPVLRRLACGGAWKRPLPDRSPRTRSAGARGAAARAAT